MNRCTIITDTANNTSIKNIEMLAIDSFDSPGGSVGVNGLVGSSVDSDEVGGDVG
jgi:hypothetical protein